MPYGFKSEELGWLSEELGWLSEQLGQNRLLTRENVSHLDLTYDKDLAGSN